MQLLWGDNIYLRFMTLQQLTSKLGFL